MLPLCLWQDEAINCTKLFKAIETDFGKCNIIISFIYLMNFRYSKRCLKIVTIIEGCVFNMIPQTLLSRYL